MADETANNNNNNNNNDGGDSGSAGADNSSLNIGDGQTANSNSDLTSDSILSKHLDIAIEAQDGKKPDKDTNLESGKEKVGTDAKPDDGKGGKGSGSDKSSQQQPDGKGKKDEKQVAGPKDLTLADGTIIKGGAERRFYEQLGVARQQNAHLTERNADLSTRLAAAERRASEIENTVRQVNGMKPSDLAVASNIFNDLQKDPVGTVKKLLAELVAAGHTVEGIGAGVDAMAITRAVEAQLAKLGVQPQNNDEAAIADAEKEVTAFYSTFPDARPHDQLLAKVIRDNPGTDLSTAYFQLKGAFIERGFDWSLSLEDNLKAQSDNSNTDTQQQQAGQKPLTNGRTPEGGNLKPAEEIPVAHENTDMGDIIKQSMRDAGLKID